MNQIAPIQQAADPQSMGDLADLISSSLESVRALALALRHRSSHVLAFDAACVLARVVEQDLAHAQEQAHEPSLARNIRRARSHARALHRAFGVALDRARVRDCATDIATALACDFKLDRVCLRALNRADEAVTVLEGAGRLMVLMDGTVRNERASLDGEATGGPSWMALKVNRWVLRGLSVHARLLYGDELLDELYALAEEGVSRRQQISAAVRQVGGIRQLRTAAWAGHTRIAGE